MIIIKNYIDVEASKEELWQLLQKLNERYAEISRNHISFKCIEGTPNKPGSIYKVRNHFKGKIIEIKYKLAKVFENKSISCTAEFPHALLGMKFELAISENVHYCTITEEIKFGTGIPIFGQLFDAFLKLYLFTNLRNIEKDQIERLNGFRMLFEKEPEEVPELV